MNSLRKRFVFVVTFLILMMVAPNTVQAQPPFPAVFSGTVLLGGNPADPGTKLYGQIGDYRSFPVSIGQNGKFVNLVVGPATRTMIGRPVSFVYQGLVAAETIQFTGGILDPRPITLTFPALPPTGDNQMAGIWMVMGAMGMVLISGGTLLLRRRSYIWPLVDRTNLIS